jgi:hypothetical protein
MLGDMASFGCVGVHKPSAWNHAYLQSITRIQYLQEYLQRPVSSEPERKAPRATGKE